MRYRAVISYDGANYVGWQRQLNGVSVQEKTEIALTKIFGTPTSCTASGRTDSGVHAEGQVIHFDAVTSIPTDKIPYAVNTELPDDISMPSCLASAYRTALSMRAMSAPGICLAMAAFMDS